MLYKFYKYCVSNLYIEASGIVFCLDQFCPCFSLYSLVCLLSVWVPPQAEVGVFHQLSRLKMTKMPKITNILWKRSLNGLPWLRKSRLLVVQGLPGSRSQLECWQKYLLSRCQQSPVFHHELSWQKHRKLAVSLDLVARLLPNVLLVRSSHFSSRYSTISSGMHRSFVTERIMPPTSSPPSTIFS